MSNQMRDKLNAALGKEQAAQGQQQQQNQQQQSSGFKAGNDIFQMSSGGFTFRPIFDQFGTGGATFDKIHEVAAQACEALNKNSTGAVYSVHRILKEDYGNNYSAIAIASTVKDDSGKQFSIFHTLVIEGTGEYPAPYNYQIGNGQSIQITRTPASAFDEKFTKCVKHQLSLDLRNPKLNSSSVDGFVVYQNFDPTDEAAVRRVLGVSINAVYSETLTLVHNIVGEPLSTFTKNKDSKFGLGIRFTNDSQMGIDVAGMPYRRDAAIRLSTKMGHSNQQSIHSGSTSETLIDIYSYTDFEYIAPNFNQMYMQPGQMVDMCRFMPRQVITMPETGGRTLMTPSLLAMMLVSTLSLATEQTWAQGFIENMGTTDIGLLNIQGNLENVETGYGVPFNTKAKDIGPQALYNFIRTLVKPSLLVSIDVPVAAPSTWYLSILAHAAKGDQSALSRISGAINTLVGGGFQSSHPIFLPNVNIVHGGYYIEKGERYDLRKATSYLGFTKLVHEKNLSPALINEYTNTMQAMSVAPEVRAQNRLDLVRQLGIDPVVNQQYERLTFHPGWLTDLVSALARAGFSPVSESVGMNNDMFQTRGFDYSQFGVSPDTRITGQAASFGFNTSFGFGNTRTF